MLHDITSSRFNELKGVIERQIQPANVSEWNRDVIERHRETERDIERQRETQRDIERHRETQRDIERHRET